MKRIIIALFFLQIGQMKAQFKVGNNATSIDSQNNLEIEALSTDKVFINKTDGRVFIQNKPNASSIDSVVMRNAYGEIRQISINRLMGFQDLDGDGLSNNVDLDDDGDGIADDIDKCSIQFGCPSYPINGTTHGCPVNCFPMISSLNCSASRNVGMLTSGSLASGVFSIIPYTGGNGGAYNSISFASTGVLGLTASISSGSFANGADSIIVNISGTPSGAGTAYFTIKIGGQTCTLTRVVDYSVIASLDGCPNIMPACMSPDCNRFPQYINSTPDANIWNACGGAQASPGSSTSEGAGFSLPSTLQAGTTYLIEVKWLTFCYTPPILPMGFSIKTGGCTGNVLVTSAFRTPICSGSTSSCETWDISTYSITPSTNISTIYVVAFGGNGASDFILFDYIKIKK